MLPRNDGTFEMSMAVKLSDDLISEARHEAKATDRSLTSQIEHWARLGREIESVLRHDDVLNLKRAGQQKVHPAPLTRHTVLAALRRIASEKHRDLALSLTAGRVVYQDAGDGRIERIDVNGERTIGRFVGRRFVADEAQQRRR